MVDSPNMGEIYCGRTFANIVYNWFYNRKEYTRHIAACETEISTFYLQISVQGELLKFKDHFIMFPYIHK